MLKIILFLLFSFHSLANPRVVYPLNAEPIAAGAKKYDLSLDYSLTTSYYDSEGLETALGENQNYSLIDTTFKLSYGYSQKLEVGLSGTFRNISSQGAFYNDTVENVYTKSGLYSLVGNFKWAFGNSKNYKYALVGDFAYKPFSVEDYTISSQIPEEELILGDAGYGFSLGMALDYLYTKWTTIEMEARYRLPSTELSAEIPYRIALVKHFNTWAFWGGFKGVQSLGLDSQDDQLFQATGATSRWNSVNRSWQKPFGGLRVLFSNKYRLSAELSKSIAGTSTDGSFDIYGSLSWTTGGKTKVERFEESFKEYTAEATVIKISPRGKFLKIDKGIAHDISKGARVDLYKTDYFGGNKLLASGVIYEAGPNWAIIRVLKKYRRVPLEKGLTARVK